LQATLERLVDFDRINADEMHLSVGAVNVRSGNFVYFDSKSNRIGPSHIIASGSLPPGFPPTEIEGEHYWDGGLVSNTPLQYVLDARPRQDTLAFQVDLWNAEGDLPSDITESQVRQKEIQYSSRTRAATEQYKRAQKLRLAVANLIRQLPDEARATPDVKMLEQEADDKVCNIVHLIYRARSYQGIAKDFEFSRRTMEEHWRSGYNDAVRTLRHPEVLQRPNGVDGVFTFDLARDGRE
jgi:NTE family protein